MAVEKTALDTRGKLARDYCSDKDLEAELTLLEDTASTSRAVMTRSYSDTIKLLESNLSFYVGFCHPGRFGHATAK